MFPLTFISWGEGGGGEGIGMCAKGYSFLAFLVCKRVSILTFRSEIMYGLCPLVLNCFFQKLLDLTIFLLMFTPTIYVPQQYSFVSHLIQRINITFNIRPT